MKSPKSVPALAVGIATLLLVLILGNVGEVVADAPRILDVFVTNDGTSPAVVRDVDNPTRQPFAMDFDLEFTAGSSAVGLPGDPGGSASFTVPSGKRLVIEFATAICNVPSGQQCRLGILESESGVLVKHDLAVSDHQLWPVTHLHTATQPMRIYIEPSGSVFVFGRRSDGTGTGTLDFSLSGYFVDVP